MVQIGRKKAITYFPSRIRASNVHSPYAEMFREDFGLDIVPFLHDKQEAVQFKISGQDKDKAIAMCLSVSQYKQFNSTDEEKISEIIRTIGRNLIWSKQGYSLYELVEEKDVPELIFIPIYRLISLPFIYLQCICKEGYQYTKKHFNYLVKKNVWRISMPKAFGGRKEYSSLIRKLEKYGNFLPSFSKGISEKAMHEQILVTPIYKPFIESYILKLTKEFGWNLRSTEGLSDFYYIYRNIKFKKAKVILREHIVEELNNLFIQLKLDAKIATVSSVTIESLSNQMADLINLEMNFSDFLRKYTYL